MVIYLFEIVYILDKLLPIILISHLLLFPFLKNGSCKRVNALADNLVLSVKLFADDTSLFSTVHGTVASRTPLSNDFKKISE